MWSWATSASSYLNCLCLGGVVLGTYPHAPSAVSLGKLAREPQKPGGCGCSVHKNLPRGGQAQRVNSDVCDTGTTHAG